MKKVLIATLGESPIVISAMVKVLQEQKNIRLDKVIVLYPKAESRWINFGYDLLQDHFSKHPEIEAIELSFDDAYTESHSIEFLRTLNGLLLQQKGLGHEVHLSLAGGRKHTSVLMGLLTQFYPMVKGLYHLHDTAEHQPHQRRTIEQLINLSETQRRHYLSPPAERFRLVDLPCESLAQAEPLQQWLMQYEASETPAPVPISPHAESFYGMLFDQDRAASNSPLLEIWLTQTAYDQYCRWYQQGSSHLAIIDTYLKDITELGWHRQPKRIHDHESDPNPNHIQEQYGTPLNHFVAKKARTAERVFYYTQPVPITDQRYIAERVIITRFAIHRTAATYDMSLHEWVSKPDVIPRFRASELPARPMVLIATLGETPMVVTQAYTLLSSTQYTTSPLKIAAIGIVYPQRHVPARNGTNILREVCGVRGITLMATPCDIEDLNCAETVSIFTASLREAIGKARSQFPEAQIAMLLSGGRKGMSTLAFYTAQREQLTQVYHTTISDPEREREIENRTSLKALEHMPKRRRAELMFLDTFDLAGFSLISIPIIPLRVGTTHV